MLSELNITFNIVILLKFSALSFYNKFHNE